MKIQVCARLMMAGLLWLTLGGLSLAEEGKAESPIAEPATGVIPMAADPKQQPPPPLKQIDRGDTAWMLVSSALVLMMTAPGLALFYGGLVRKKNILGVMMQCIALMGVMSVVWVLWGYSLAFDKSLGETGLGRISGGFGLVMLNGIGGGNSVNNKTIPDLLHMVYQMMFFIITPGLICGAFAERMKFSAMLLFSVLWGTFVYCPVAHWVWAADGWLAGGEHLALDFAGGTVVHLISGASALLCAIMLGKRLGFGQEPMPPHNLTYTFIGATMLWVGWFGFNAGSALEASSQAVYAFVSTHLAAATGTLAWAGLEWLKRGKPSILGACSGAVAGLVCVTPAAGFVTPVSGMILGIIAGGVCYFACTTLKSKFGYDDSLDAFGVHGVGGFAGAILTGVFANSVVSGNDDYKGMLQDGGNLHQVINQLVGAGAALALTLVGSFIILKLLDAVIGLRVNQEAEIQGLDLSQHGEEGYIFY
ncbi:MAG: ammonium transporter [Planctomycetaceae bacterium]